MLIKVMFGSGISSVDASQFEVAHDSDGVKTSVSLPFEGVHKTI